MTEITRTKSELAKIEVEESNRADSRFPCIPLTFRCTFPLYTLDARKTRKIKRSPRYVCMFVFVQNKTGFSLHDFFSTRNNNDKLFQTIDTILVAIVHFLKYDCFSKNKKNCLSRNRKDENFQGHRHFVEFPPLMVRSWLILEAPSTPPDKQR